VLYKSTFTLRLPIVDVVLVVSQIQLPCRFARHGRDELMLMYSSHGAVCFEANELLHLLCCRTLNVNMRNLCVNMPKIKGMIYGTSTADTYTVPKKPRLL